MEIEITARGAVVRNAIVAVAYTILGLISLRLVQNTGVAAAVWPSAGIAFAAVFQWGPRMLPGVFAGSIAVNVTSLWLGGSPWLTVLTISSGVAAGAAVQAWLGAFLVQRILGPRPSLTNARQVLLFMVLAGLLACLLNPTLGVSAQLLVGFVEPGEAWMVWLTWWVGDAIGVIVFGPLTLMLLPEQREVWQGRRLRVAIPSLLVLFMAVGAFVQYSALERRQQEMQLTAQAQEVTHDLRTSVAMSAASLEGVRSLFESQEQVSEQQFRDYTHDMLEESALLAVSWNPVVPQERLAAFTAEAQAELGPGFEVYAKDANGARVPVGPQPFYVPVTYIEPLERNAAAVGYDIESNSERADAIARAMRTGLMQITAPISLVQTDDTQNGVLMLVPMYGSGDASPSGTDGVTGFAVGVYRMQSLVEATFADTQWRLASIVLTDVTSGSQVTELAQTGDATPLAGAPGVGVERFVVGGRVWQVAVIPPAEMTADEGLPAAPAFLIGGLLISVLLEAFLLLMTGIERNARRMAEESSYRALHDPLTDLLNRRAFVAALEETRQTVIDSGSTAVLMYLDLDGFKQVNDHAGHEAGDEMLCSLSRLLRDRIKPGDVVARIGGDEFAFILANCSSARGIDVATALVNDVESFTLERPEGRFTVSASIGVLEFGGADVEVLEDLMHLADRACYEAKRAGNGRIRMASPLGIGGRS